jgi:HK97 family phage prohead protease
MTESWLLERSTAIPRVETPPADGFRGFRPEEAFEVRGSNGTGEELVGHLAVFNEWTQINSEWEGGPFLERVAKGAFRKTFAERGKRLKVLFQHGHDALTGDRPLGTIEELREDEHGAFYRVKLLPTTYNADLIPGLRAGLYGSSFRFSSVKENFNKRPGRSDTNPDGLPERTLQEVKLYEFGPVTFPAYAGATAGLRSLSDYYIDPKQLARRKARKAKAQLDDLRDRPWLLGKERWPDWRLSKERA